MARELHRVDGGVLPGEKELAHYRELGWYISPRLLDDDEIETLDAVGDAFWRGERDRALPADPPGLARWTAQDGEVQRNSDYIHYESDAIGRILRKPEIGATAAALAGVDVVRIFQATLLYKPARAGEDSNIVPWHADKYYWSTSTSERMLTAFIPFHDLDTSMGTLTVVEGSHRWRPLPLDRIQELRAAGGHRQELLEAAAEFNGDTVRPVPLEIPRGHMSFHHCRLYHGSSRNASGQARRSISLHLQDGDNRFGVSPGSEGGLGRAYKHDYLVRTNAEGHPDYTDPVYCPVVWPVPEPAGGG